MKIDSYSFGSITVDGKCYDKDIIVFPDAVHTNWQRKEGHSLSVEDLQDVIDYQPKVLIIGTGAYGVLKIPVATRETLNKLGIELIARNTDEACKVFNERIKQGEKVVAAFHLTC